MARKLTTASLTNADIRALRDIAKVVGETSPGMLELIVTCDLALSTRKETPYSVIVAARKAVVNIINARNTALAKRRAA